MNHEENVKRDRCVTVLRYNPNRKNTKMFTMRKKGLSMKNGKSSLSKRILTAVTAAAVMVPVLTVSLPAVAANAEPLTITGQLSENKWQMNYVIPQDAPETVILDGRDLMDMLVKRGEYNAMYPGTWTGGWFTLKNQSGYTYKVTDVEFALDHAQTQENSRVLSDLSYNPYEIGQGDFFGTDRPERIKNYVTGAVGFDGYAIPGAMTVLRSRNLAIQQYYNLTDASSIKMAQVLKLDEALKAENKTYSEYLAEAYKASERFAPVASGTTSFADLPLYCFTDSLCGPSYAMWQADDPTGQGRWKAGDVKLEGVFVVPVDGGGYRRVYGVEVYDKYDADGTPHYYYVDKNEFGEDAANVEIDIYSDSFEFIDTDGFMTQRNYFKASELGDMTGVNADYYWQDSGNRYTVLETDPAVVKRAYDSFYTDMLSFTFDSKKYPITYGRRDIGKTVSGDEYVSAEYTEGAEGMHYYDYMMEQGKAKQIMDSTVGSWVVTPSGTDGDWVYSYSELKLSGQNTSNNYAGTELMRGLTFKVTLERVNAAYSVEYYQDEVAPENLLGVDDGYTAALGSTVQFPAGVQNNYRPVTGGYKDGVLVSADSIVLQEDASKNIFQVVYTHDPYRVLYNANGGTGTQSDDNSPYFADETVTVLGQGGVTRDGYDFLGWNTSADGTGTAYVAGNTFIMPEADVTLFAQWAEQVEIPDEEPPLVGPDDPEIPDEEPPLVGPEEETPNEEEISDEEVPLAGPKTGDNNLKNVAAGMAALALLGGAVVLYRRKGSEE